MDDGADLVSTIHQKHTDLLPQMIGGTEETTTGVIRLRAMAKDGALKMPIVAVNDAKTKNLFDNRYGTGQSTLDGIIRATDMLLAGKTVVVAGYGWCGKGLAMRAKGMGASVVVTEVDPIKALEAADGRLSRHADGGSRDGGRPLYHRDRRYQCHHGRVISGDEERRDRVQRRALRRGDRHPGIGQNGLVGRARACGISSTSTWWGIKEIYLLAEGRLVNLAAAEGHPASVMDMSFATQALASEWMANHPPTTGLRAAVYDVPEEIEQQVAQRQIGGHGGDDRHADRRAKKVPRELAGGHVNQRFLAQKLILFKDDETMNLDLTSSL